MSSDSTASRKIRKQRIPINRKHVMNAGGLSKLKALQNELDCLKTQMQQSLSHPLINSVDQGSATTFSLGPLPVFSSQNDISPYQSFDKFGFPSLLPFDHMDWNTPSVFTQSLNDVGFEQPNANMIAGRCQQSVENSEHNENFGQAKIIDIKQADFVTACILTEEQAETYINMFFRGCGRYFPFTDLIKDSAHKIRERSSVLFNTMCSLGYRAQQGDHAPLWKSLDLHVSRMLDTHITSGPTTVEFIQALLIRACYSPERLILLSMATRMAVEIGLPDAYDDIRKQLVLSKTQSAHAETMAWDVSLQKLRTWLFILVMRLMLGVDKGTSLDLVLYGDVRRCRILLGKPFSTELDLCLLEQIELNVLMAKINRSITEGALSMGEEDLVKIVQNVAVDIDVWFDDWAYILNSQPHQNWLKLNIKVQRHWAEITILCWAIHSLKTDYLATSSAAQRNVQLMAKAALQQHLKTILSEPQLYIHNLRYATDYVWAKFVYCFLLLLETSSVASDSSNGQESKQDLVAQGFTLLEELTKADGILTGQTCSHVCQDYLQLLRSGIERFSQSTLSLPKDQPIGFCSSRDFLNSPPEVQSLRGSFVSDHFAIEWKFPYPGLCIY
ncbi:unnamed protein product [Clonostachys solani]|uniref:Transcription factor domain-containing protein n=1 Tax=Clonostachys solani TaxID=160281 RepID=A0A9N9Z8V7_9HYPO|nr:unnamed protein product [Clonostachys solani]